MRISEAEEVLIPAHTLASNAIARFKANNPSHNEVVIFFWENTPQPVSFSQGKPDWKALVKDELERKRATGTHDLPTTTKVLELARKIMEEAQLASHAIEPQID